MFIGARPPEVPRGADIRIPVGGSYLATVDDAAVEAVQVKLVSWKP